MKVPFSWLKELVPIKLSAEDLAEKLSMSGFEVEELINLSANSEGVVVGKVKSVKPHDNSTKLQVCEVDVGERDLLQIVCGAKNVRGGIYVPVALVGASLKAINTIIKTSKIRGIESNGMICSRQELGIASSADGIFILSESVYKNIKVGDKINNILGLNDYIFDLAITANRPEGFSVIGIAQEVSAITNQKFSLDYEHEIKEFEQLTPKNKIEEKIASNYIYCLSNINKIDVGHTNHIPVKERLEKSGINSVNSIVDIINYVMLEYGQPMHAFDSSKLENQFNKIILAEEFSIRYAIEGETIDCLNNKVYQLSSENLLICYLDQPIAIAGVIGCSKYSVDENTKSIWLEAAVFPQSVIRASSRKLGIRTESSSRFEKGLHYQLTTSALRRTEFLLNRSVSTIEIKRYQLNKNKPLYNPICLRLAKVKKVLGPLKYTNKFKTKSEANQLNEKHLSEIEIIETLSRIGCKVVREDNKLNVFVPIIRRIDLTREIDLIEEIARLIGYDNFNVNLPKPIKPGIINNIKRIEINLRKSLCCLGLQEVTTFSLVGKSNNEEYRIPIKNPLLAETSHLRNNILDSLINVCVNNYSSGSRGCWVFEIGNAYVKKDSLILEQKILCGVLSGEKRLERWASSGKPKELNYYEARGKLEEALQNIKIHLKDKKLIKPNINYHPGRSAELYLEGKVIGQFGQLHPSRCEKYGLTKNTYIFELQVIDLYNSACRSNNIYSQYKSYNTLPFLERDIALLLDKSILCNDVMAFIKKNGKPLLEKVELLDEFTGESIAKDKISLTYRLSYRSLSKTLEDSEVYPIHQILIQRIIDKFNAEIR